LSAPEPLRLRSPGIWIVLAPAIGLIALGLVLIVSPRLGAAIFGIPAEGTGLRYVAALGVRDLTFGLYVAALALFVSPRAVGIVLALTVLIPIGDIAILLAERGLSAPGHLLLHGLSGLYMAGAALWTLRGSCAA
jgi:hypothetical protein